MDITLLGTAAAEAVPDPFCRCRVCETARREGGAEIRARASALVNDDLLIDLGPDILTSANAVGAYLGDLRILLVTHRHSDHWLPHNLYWRKPGFTPTPTVPLTIYGPADALAEISPELMEGANFVVEPVHAGDCWEAAGYTITAVPATHGGGDLEPLLYVITRDRSRIFYATDTAPLETAAWDVLRPLAPMDLIVQDATSGHQSGGEAHHGMDQFFATQARMIKEGLIEEGRTTLVAHHFSHNGGLTHRQLVEAYGARGVTVAYDGLTLSVS
jgi:phosphoribosyl 1,2-cyclic phosphate phosphodiesterase